jgi:ABC-type Fe3+/spermidine/putrescine transport system ATPase subunit
VVTAAPAGDRLEVEVEGPGFRGTCRAAQDCTPGQRVAVVLRPEDVRFSNGHARPDALRWTGEVMESIFRGPYRSYTIRTESGTILLDGAGQASAAPGSRVTIEADECAGWVLPC